MRNVNNWQVYPQGTQPAMNYGGRGYTGHEHLSGFGLINMNARLYDPMLARFLAPDPYVGSGLTNDFNRYIYCRNNPLMFTDPSGMSWKSFWKEFGDAFVRDFNKTFGNNQGGWQLGYNSSGGFFINPTYNGSAFGPSVGINNSGQFTTGNSQGGFHNMTPVGQSSRLEQSVVQAEQSARGEYFKYNSMVSDYSRSMSNWFKQHIFMESEFRIDEGDQIALQAQFAGFKVGFDFQKDTSPLVQGNLIYNKGWSSCVYENSPNDYGYPSDFLRTSLSGGIGLFGASGSFESTSSFFSLGNWRTETINIGPATVNKMYNTNGSISEKQFSLDFGFNLSFKYGIHGKFRFGYQY